MKHAYLTVDLGFGDAGKGSIVDFLVRYTNAHTVVRFNGGAQAGHRVVAPDGREHVFSQFGSGTLAGAKTHLSRFMLVDPLAMMAEEEHLRQIGVPRAFGRTTISTHCRITTPYHRAVNRLKELARDSRHGSCGMGIGETMVDWLAYGNDTLFAGDLTNPDKLAQKLAFLRQVNCQKVTGLHVPYCEQAEREWQILHDDWWHGYLMERYAEFVEAANVVSAELSHAILNQDGAIIYEAAQGVLLDEWYGFHPHTTWSTTTLANAYALLREVGYDGEVTRIGITRAYQTRHGAGPFVSESETLTRALPDAVNGFDAWQEGFRVGWLDLVLLRYALAVVGDLDMLAVTCLDRLVELDDLFVCNGYEGINDLPLKSELEDLDFQARLTQELFDYRPKLHPISNKQTLLSTIENATGVRVGLISEGVSAEGKRQAFTKVGQEEEKSRASTLACKNRRADGRFVKPR